MEHVGAILQGNRHPQRPDEHARVQSYIKEQLHIEAHMLSGKDSLTILVAHGAAATTVRLHLQEIATNCAVTKRLWVRIDGSINTKNK